MDTSPSINSSIRSLLILLGGVGVSKGWWDQDGLEGLVDHLIVWGGATIALAGAGWGIYSKLAASKEAKVIAMRVLKADDAESSGR